ncbi:MAG: DUF998 domain-containing protein, partial [Acidimicrobiales bacterium]|nr:DUF998 domain-containing protein [Acidimicrobiales bacterium]
MAEDLNRIAVRQLTASPRRIADAALGLAVLVYAGVLVASDLADEDHALWRDHLSFFGSSEASYPSAFALAQGFLALAALAWFASRWSELGRSGRILLPMAVLAAMGAAIWPIDCSPSDELCEVIIRNRAVSTSHDVHSLLAIVLFASLAAFAVSVSLLTRRRVAIAAAVVAVVGTGWIVARPFAAGSGVVELGVVIASVWNLKLVCSGPMDRTALR